MVHSGSAPFPSEPDIFLSYVRSLQAENAAPSAYSEALQAMAFFEKAGERPQESWVSTLPSVQNAVDEAKAQAHAAKPAGSKRQAPPLTLSIVAALESVVVDEKRACFTRAFSWYRLLRHWTSMRWDDTRGLSPASLKWRARGLVGSLTRTKTSGPGKSQSVLPIFISSQAFLKEPKWLLKGLKLWQSDLYYDRDYFLPLPNEDLSGMVRRQANYSDVSAFSRRLFGSLEAVDGSALLDAKAADFWSEHSDRAGLDSWLAALNVAAPERGFVGRWAATGSQDTYVRTALRVVENLQLQAVRFARESWKSGPDFFGEEHTLELLKGMLLSRGWSPENADDQVARLTSADASIFFSIELTQKFSAISARSEAEEAPTTPRRPDVDEREDTDSLDFEGDPSAISAEQIEEARDLVHEQTDPQLEPIEGFFVATSRKGMRRKLHFAGACRLAPDLADPLLIRCGGIMPAADSFDGCCAICFPGERLGLRGEAVQVSEDESSSSSESQ